MKVALITRSTLYSAPGGDSIQIIETAKQLNLNGVSADIKLAFEIINYNEYDLLHFFNITRPADMLHHIHASQKPFVVSTNFVDYSNYDKHHRKGLSGFVFGMMSPDRIEYAKTMLRFIMKKDKLISLSYILKGQRKSINEILIKAKLILPNSQLEYTAITNSYRTYPKYAIVPNGISKELFKPDNEIEKNPLMVICAARIEGLKNQLNLIKALNNSIYQVFIIGKPAPNQASYYKECKKIAASNINFINHLSQVELLAYYKKAKVHILPSWFETTGLSSLEAAAMGCSIVITDCGYTKEYFGEDAIYCNPESTESIFNAVADASKQPQNKIFQKKIISNYTWQQAALQTIKAYKLKLEN